MATHEMSIDYLCRECDEYSEYQNQTLVSIRTMLEYIERNDPTSADFKRLLSIIHRIGVLGHRVYEYVRRSAIDIRRRKQAEESPLMKDLDEQYRKRLSSCNLQIRESWSKALPRLPPWPVLSSYLDDDVTSCIFSFLDDESFATTGRVSKAFYLALVSRQRRVNLSGCQYSAAEKFLWKASAESCLWNYTGIESFSGRVNSHLVIDRFLGFLCHDHPMLRHVDLYGCDNLSIVRVDNFVRQMGPRLQSFTMTFLPRGGGRVKALGETLSKASSLGSLSLTLNSHWIAELDFSCFNGHTSLKNLSMTVDGPIELPKDLPNLEVLELHFIDEIPADCWTELSMCRYPKCKRLEFTVSNYAYPALSLSIDTLISALSKVPRLESLLIRRLQHDSPLDEQDDLKKIPLSEELTQTLNVLRRVTATEAEEMKRLLAFANKHKIQCITDI